MPGGARALHRRCQAPSIARRGGTAKSLARDALKRCCDCCYRANQVINILVFINNALIYNTLFKMYRFVSKAREGGPIVRPYLRQATVKRSLSLLDRPRFGAAPGRTGKNDNTWAIHTGRRSSLAVPLAGVTDAW